MPDSLSSLVDELTSQKEVMFMKSNISQSTFFLPGQDQKCKELN